jgi:hypothetical protein
MTTLKYVDKLIIDSTGPLRKIRLPDGLYVVGEQMLIAVDSEEEADDINPWHVILREQLPANQSRNR